ncbi:MAG: 23S rRNA (guanosine(2251)-2'-O)-methyltransferase RlmB [Clostridia bacterium]|nr:23S rRNA (guanosine(2251)-2'-O)-methyltransferase RlmB [Clostridia bacterium]
MQIEGRNQVREAIVSNLTINKLLIDKNFSNRKDEIINMASKARLKIEYMPKSALDKISKTSHHQGYIAEVVDFSYSTVEEIMDFAKDSNTPPFIVLLDGIEDPHNLGAIIRSCECAGVHGIILPKNRACKVNETVIRTSAGAIANMKIAEVVNLKEAIDYLKDNGVWIYAAETGGNLIYNEDLKGPIAIVIGSEGKGVKPSIRTYCDGIVTLPLCGNVNSLNASVACGIVVFEILRQRSNK